MSPIEIVFVVLGIVLIIVSCFLAGKEETKTEITQISDDVLEFQKKEAEKLIQQILEEKTEDAVVKADDYLSKISNEKIMAVNEFTDQILERIDGNHKEVVFLYDMLNQKEDDIKRIVQEFDKEKAELLETVQEVSKLSKQWNTKVKKSETGATDTPKPAITEKKTEEKQ